MSVVRTGSSSRALSFAKSRRARVGVVGALGIVVTAIGCASQAPSEGDNGVTVGETSEAITLPTSICGQKPLASIDDVPAYRNDCGDHPIYSDNGRNTRDTAAAGWVATEEAAAGYQCVELAIRYEYFKFDVGTHWGIDYAAEMCDHHPLTGVTVIPRTGTPVHGDLMVFPAGGALGKYGHVAVVGSASSTHVSVVQENVGAVGATTYPKSYASCFIHASRNNDCGNAANGAYCGNTTAFSTGKTGTLYTCESHAVHATTVCAHGCDSISGASDKCNPAPIDAGEDAGEDGGDGDLTTDYDDGGSPDDDTDAGDGIVVYGDDGGDDSTAATTPTANTGESGGCSAAAHSHENDSRAMWLVGIGAALVLVKRRRRL